MKKLKIFLPILLISLFFIPKVSALSTNYNGSLSYNETTLSNIDTNQERINALNTYFENLGTITYLNTNYNINDGTYIIQVTNTSFGNDTWTIYLVNNLDMQWWWRTSDRVGRFSIGGVGLELNINFNGNNVTSHSVAGVGSYFVESCWSTNENWTGNPMNEDIEVKLRNYFDTYFLNSNQNISLSAYGQSGFYDIPVKIADSVAEAPNTINAKAFFDSLMPYSNPFACHIDIDSLSGFRDAVVSNIDEFSIHVKGTIPDDSDSFDGSFALKSNSNRLVNDPNIVFDLDITDLSGNNIGGAATYDWYNDENILVVTYSLGNSSGEDVDMIISVKPDSSSTTAISFFSKSLSIFYCNPLNLNDDITYGYIDSDTDISYSSDTSLINFLNDTNNPDLSFFSNLKTVLPVGPVDSILTLPLTMLNSISNAMGDTCNPITLNIPYLNRNVVIPCINTFYDAIGATALFNVIGGVASVLILGEYFIFLYNWVDNTLRFSDHKLRMWGAANR